MTQIIDKLFKSKILLASFFSIAVVLLAVIVYWSISPSNSPARIIVSIKDGTTLSQAANELQNDKVIKSELIYKVFVVLLGGRRKVIAGDYLFDSPQSALRVAFRTVNGEEGLPQIK